MLRYLSLFLICSSSFASSLPFGKTLYPWLRESAPGVKRCATCHEGMPGRSFASPDVEQAYKDAQQFIKLEDLDHSRFVDQAMNGHCGLELCRTDGTEIKALLKQWIETDSSLIEYSSNKDLSYGSSFELNLIDDQKTKISVKNLEERSPIEAVSATIKRFNQSGIILTDFKVKFKKEVNFPIRLNDFKIDVRFKGQVKSHLIRQKIDVYLDQEVKLFGSGLYVFDEALDSVDSIDFRLKAETQIPDLEEELCNEERMEKFDKNLGYWINKRNCAACHDGKRSTAFSKRQWCEVFSSRLNQKNPSFGTLKDYLDEVHQFSIMRREDNAALASSFLEREGFPFEIEKVIQVSSGGAHTCVLLESKKVKCFGKNTSGQLGLDHDEDIGNDPGEMDLLAPIAFKEKVKQISAGSSHTCVVFESGKASCFGDNGMGNLGLGHTNGIGKKRGDIEGLKPIAFSEKVTQISAGFDQTCALFEGGIVRCWGNGVNASFEDKFNNTLIGDERGEIEVLTPIPIGEKAIKVYAGYNASCALLVSNTIRCWGKEFNFIFKLPADEVLDTETTFIIANPYYFCYLPKNKEMKCMGNPPKAFQNLDKEERILQIDGQSLVHCFRYEDGSVQCFGRNYYGETGSNESGSMSQMISGPRIEFPRKVAKLSVGDGHVCALLEGGTLKCWGQNYDGELGLDDGKNRGKEKGDIQNLPDAKVSW